MPIQPQTLSQSQIQALEFLLQHQQKDVFAQDVGAHLNPHTMNGRQQTMSGVASLTALARKDLVVSERSAKNGLLTYQITTAGKVWLSKHRNAKAS